MTKSVIGNVASIPIEKLKPSPANVRGKIDPKTVEDLKKSIEQQGLISYLRVRPVNGHFEVIAGHRRLEAVKQLGWKEVYCIVAETDESSVFNIQLIENLQRENLPPLQEAHAFNRILGKKSTQEDVKNLAAAIGKSPEYIARRRLLVDLIPELQKLLESNGLPVSHALELCRTGPEVQRDVYSDSFRNSWSVPTLKSLLQSIERHLLQIDKAPFDTTDESLNPQRGACAGCPKNSATDAQLFADIKGARCFDPGCWKIKVKAHLDRAKEAYEAEGRHLQKISVSNWLSDENKGVMTSDKYRIVDKPAAGHGRYGIYIDGQKQGKVVAITLASELEDRKAGNAGPGLSTPQLIDRTEKRLNTVNARIQQSWQRSAYQELLSKVKWPLKREDLLTIVEQLGDWIQRPSNEFIAAALGIEPGKDGEYDFDVDDIRHSHYISNKKTETIVRAMNDHRLAALALAIALEPGIIHDPSYPNVEEEDEARLNEALKRYSVDVKPHQAKAEEQFKKQKDRIEALLTELTSPKKPPAKKKAKPKKK